MRFITTVKEGVREYKVKVSPRGYGFFQTPLVMAKLGYVFKERVISKATGVAYDVYIREEKL